MRLTLRNLELCFYEAKKELKEKVMNKNVSAKIAQLENALQELLTEVERKDDKIRVARYMYLTNIWTISSAFFESDEDFYKACSINNIGVIAFYRKVNTEIEVDKY